MLRELKETILLVSSCELWRMGILWTISLLESYFQLLIGRFCGSKSTPSACSMDSQSGLSSKPVCVITGPTSGLGKATACALAKKGFHVILAGRSTQALSETMKEIRSQNEDAKLTAFEVDMTSYQSMLQFLASLKQYFSESGLPNSIQLLVNNAGIMPVSSRPTIEGYDRTIATNYIGPFTLTHLLLLPLVNSSVPARVVNVTSFTHRHASLHKFDKDSVTGVPFSTSDQYPFGQAYEYSKLCLAMFSHELHRQCRLKKNQAHISVLSADPGLTKTNLMRDFPPFIVQTMFLVSKILGLLQSPDDGAKSIVDAALASPEISGAYYFGGKGRTIKPSEVSLDPKLAKQLRDTSFTVFDDLLDASSPVPKEYTHIPGSD